MFKTNAIMRQGVKMRRLEYWMARTAHHIPPLIICDKNNNVWTFIRLFFGRSAQTPYNRQTTQSACNTACFQKIAPFHTNSYMNSGNNLPHYVLVQRELDKYLSRLNLKVDLKLAILQRPPVAAQKTGYFDITARPAGLRPIDKHQWSILFGWHLQEN